MLFVGLLILWAGAGVYWLRNRVPTTSLTIGSYTRRIASIPTPRLASPRATVLPINGIGLQSPEPIRSTVPGYSLQPTSAPLYPSTPRSGMGRVSREQARLRRRNVLIGLATSAFVTLLMAVTARGSMIVLHLFVDAVLLGYVLMLVQYQREIDLSRTQARPVIAAPSSAYAATGTGHF